MAVMGRNTMHNLYVYLYNKILNEASTSRFIGSHAHRIVPYQTDDVVFLEQKIHSLIHWLRWKIWHLPQDKAAYKMIGRGPSGLSYEDRVLHGKWCSENNIGIHNMSDEQRIRQGYTTYDKQKQIYLMTGAKNFYYWSTPAGRKERAKLGGSASCKTNQKFIDKQCAFKYNKIKASEASKKSAKKPATNGVIIKKFHTNEQLEQFLQENEGWRKGYLTKKEKLALEQSSSY